MSLMNFGQKLVIRGPSISVPINLQNNETIRFPVPMAPPGWNMITTMPMVCIRYSGQNDNPHTGLQEA